MSERTVFDRFSAIIADGWANGVEDDATYSDPDQPQPVALQAPSGGALLVSAPVLDEDADPGDSPEAAERLALEWGRRRGLPPPLFIGSEATRAGARATAMFRLGGEMIQVWLLTNGSDVLEASWVCRWEAQERDRAGRETIVASLRFA